MKSILTSIINRLVPYIPESVPEGSTRKELVHFFTRLLKENPNIQAIAETGFNTGRSSTLFLEARPDTTVVSFDIGHHISVSPAKTAIDRRFPGRHELILGDSTQTLPLYARNHPGKRFDLIFVDGGHTHEVAKADLMNFRRMSHSRTIVVMDDLTPWWVWGIGPAAVWQEATQSGCIVGSTMYKNGLPVTDLSGQGSDAIWATGHYADAQGK